MDPDGGQGPAGRGAASGRHCCACGWRLGWRVCVVVFCVEVEGPIRSKIGDADELI